MRRNDLELRPGGLALCQGFAVAGVGVAEDEQQATLLASGREAAAYVPLDEHAQADGWCAVKGLWNGDVLHARAVVSIEPIFPARPRGAPRTRRTPRERELMQHHDVIDAWVDGGPADPSLVVLAVDERVVRTVLGDTQDGMAVRIVRSRWSWSEIEQAQRAISRTPRLIAVGSEIVHGDQYRLVVSLPWVDEQVLEVLGTVPEALLRLQALMTPLWTHEETRASYGGVSSWGDGANL